MTTEAGYEELLGAEADRVDKDVREVLGAVGAILPFVQRGKIEKKYLRSRDTGQEEDTFEWTVSRDKDFVVRYLRVILRASRVSYLLDGSFDAEMGAGAGYHKKANWGDMSEYTEEQLLPVAVGNVDEMRAAITAAVKEVF